MLSTRRKEAASRRDGWAEPQQERGQHRQKAEGGWLKGAGKAEAQRKRKRKALLSGNISPLDVVWTRHEMLLIIYAKFFCRYFQFPSHPLSLPPSCTLPCSPQQLSSDVDLIGWFLSASPSLGNRLSSEKLQSKGGEGKEGEERRKGRRIKPMESQSKWREEQAMLSKDSSWLLKCKSQRKVMTISAA